MKKLLSGVLAGLMLASTALPIAAEDVPAAGLVLAEGSHLTLTDKYVDMIDGVPTVAELKANFAGAVDVADKKDTELVATDDTVSAGDQSLKALIYGDVNRDAAVNVADITGTLRHIAKWQVDINTDAADVDKNALVNVADVTKMLKSVAKWDNISLGNVRMVFENKANAVEGEDNTLDLYFYDMMKKTVRHDITNSGKNSIKMKLAKNETEGCQAVIVSDLPREGMSAELTPFVYEYGDAVLESKLEWIIYYKNHNMVDPLFKDNGLNHVNWKNSDPKWMEWVSGDIPEVVMPMTETFELQEDRAQHLVISVTSQTDSPAGMYKADLNIKDADGNIVKSAPVYAYVWDFALPDAPYSASLFCTSYFAYSDYTYEDYYNYMLDNNLSSYVLPYEITDSRADAYMSDPRVTAFVIAGGGIDGSGRPGMYGGIMDKSPEQTVANYNKVASNPDWFKKGLFYYTDEPYESGLLEVKYSYEKLVELLGTTNVRNMTPLASNEKYPNIECENAGIDPVEYIKDYINVWCPSSSAYMDTAKGGKFTTRRSLALYGEYRERAAAFKERGDTLWWYVCVGPEIPYTNLFTWYSGTIIRDLMWQQYMHNVEGLLYYGTGVWWGQISKYQFEIYNGDGVLMYPGELFGYEGPQASWRLYQLRDGFDDFDYLKMAEEKVGREEVMKIVSKVTTSMLDFTEDENVMNGCRDKLAELIMG